jgi:hypothetical protein
MSTSDEADDESHGSACVWSREGSRPRMWIRVVLLILAVSVTSGLLPRLANAKGEYSTGGIHVAFSGVFASPNWEDELREEIAEAIGGPALVALGSTGGFDMRAGYRFNERVDFEMGFEYLAPYSVDVVGLGGGEASSWMYYVDFRLFLLTDRVQPYIVLGMGAYHIDYMAGLSGVARDGTDFAPRLGGGLDYYIDYRWGLTGEINYVIGTRRLNERDRLAISFGAFYRF